MRLLSALGASLLLANSLAAEFTHVLQLNSGNRFLFIVDTSSNMRSLDLANRQALFDLVYFGINQQMTNGDTFGIWTFNKALHAGEFPLQTWNSTNNLQLGSRAATFLKQKSYSGKCNLDLVMTNVNALVRTIRDVNIVLLTDGTTPIHGTPFDEQINLAWQNRAAARAKAEKPFVTALAARNGKFSAVFVSLPGEPVLLPPPSLPQLAKTKPTAKPDSLAKTNQIASQPLIMKGSAGMPNLAIATPAPVTEPNTLPKPVSSQPLATAPASTERDKPAPVALAAPIKAEPMEAPAPAPEITKVSSKPAEPTLKQDSEPPLARLANSGNSSSAAERPNPPSKPEPQRKLASTGTAGMDSPGTASTNVPEKVSAASNPRHEDMFQEPAEPALGPASGPNRLNPRDDFASLEPNLVRSMEQTSAPSGRMMAAVAAPPWFNPQVLMMSGFVLLFVAFVLLIMVFLNIRKAPQASIISRSMESTHAQRP